MKKIVLTIAAVCLSTPVHAGWWDCEIGYRTAGWKGDGTYNYTYKGTITREVSADRRSDAEWKSGEGTYMTTGGFFSKEIYACRLGNKSENGRKCDYHFDGKGKCRSQ